MVGLKGLKKEILNAGNKETAQKLQHFFKTGKGQYGEGDVFLGIKVGELRNFAKKYWNDLSLKDTQELLHSRYHEKRLIALLILIHKYKKGDDKEKKTIHNLYLKNTKYINNWDLVDLTAPDIVGNYLIDKDRKTLYRLVKSHNLWERRIAIISTFYFIRNHQFKDTIKISEILLKDKHDIIHKAVGWMLREVGKKEMKELEKFLKKNYKKMPRTMLRYAIEKFSEEERKKWLKRKTRRGKGEKNCSC